ncbi:MAG: sodium dependent phosphate transporter [Nitriliruptorales bacterium]|nr:sodium dependent phosphate transporter [Nitriliruptorales bacterium]
MKTLKGPAALQRRGDRLPRWGRLLLVLAFLYLFLIGVGLLEGGIRAFGEGFNEGLLESVRNPLAGLFAGIAATVVVQSSSITTSTIVGLVGSGTMPVELAVPMIMGANIGTTVTNTLASLASIRRAEEFRRAFSAATMHDFFNIIGVVVLLPLELATGVLEKSARRLAGYLGRSGIGGAEAESPFRTAVKAGVGMVEGAVQAVAGVTGPALGVALLVVGVALLFVSLRLVTTNMRKVLAGRVERAMNQVLNTGGGLAGMVIGAVITVLVMSSSITTSILVPMVAAGVLTTRTAYPITLGANIGTTATALIASLAVVEPGGLQIALVHLLFNVAAIALVYPLPAVRFIPVRLSETLADHAVERRSLVAAYIAVVFVALPFLGVFLLA